MSELQQNRMIHFFTTIMAENCGEQGYIYDAAEVMGLSEYKANELVEIVLMMKYGHQVGLTVEDLGSQHVVLAKSLVDSIEFKQLM